MDISDIISEVGLISNNFNKKYMTKTDIVFYLVLLGGVVKELTEAWGTMKSGEPVDWVMIGLTVASGLIYGFYDHLTSTTPTTV